MTTAIGNRCVRAITGIADRVFEPATDLAAEEESPKAGAAKQKLDLFFTSRIPGKDGKPMREAAIAAKDIAQKVKHRQNPTRSETGASLRALCLLVDLVEAARSA